MLKGNTSCWTQRESTTLPPGGHRDRIEWNEQSRRSRARKSKESEPERRRNLVVCRVVRPDHADVRERYAQGLGRVGRIFRHVVVLNIWVGMFAGRTSVGYQYSRPCGGP